MIHLMNGNKVERVRNSDGVVVLPCGCAFTERKYLQMCDDAYQDWRRRHDDDRRRQDDDYDAR